MSSACSVRHVKSPRGQDPSKERDLHAQLCYHTFSLNHS